MKKSNDSLNAASASGHPPIIAAHVGTVAGSNWFSLSKFNGKHSFPKYMSALNTVSQTCRRMYAIWDFQQVINMGRDVGV